MVDIDQLIAASKEVGLDEIPASSANNAEAEEAILAILNASPTKTFRLRDLTALLRKHGLEVEKLGNLTHAMRNQKKLTNPVSGYYRAYDASIANFSDAGAKSDNPEEDEEE